MSQSLGEQLNQVILQIRVNWILKWAEQNVALVRCQDEALMRHRQEADWLMSKEKKYIEDIMILPRHDEETRLKILKALEVTYRLAPHYLAEAVLDDDDDDDDDDDEEEEEEDEDYDDPLPPAQHIILDTKMDEDPM